MDPDIHNSNPGEFRGKRLRLLAHDLKFPEEGALEAVRQFILEYGGEPTSRSWVAAGLMPSERTIRRRFGSFKAAVAAALDDCK